MSQPFAAMAIVALLASCAPRSSLEPRWAHAEVDRWPSAPTASPPAPPVVDEAGRRAEQEHVDAVDSMLKRVAKARGLPIRGPVTSRTLNREAISALIRKHVEQDVPLDAVAAQGEALILLDLVPSNYDFLEGSLALLTGHIAGFYEPIDRTMYLVDDLGDEGAEETLMHELVHALQDQSFSIGPMLKFMSGEGDRLSAAQTLIEGDAMSAMLDLQLGSAFRLSDERLRTMLKLSSAASADAAVTPQFLQSTLEAPYADGFAFVKALRKRGGYAAVNEVFRRLPDTTEQVLHLEKFDVREAAVVVHTPAIPANMAGFLPIFDDTMGEQGLRTILEEWAPRSLAERAAAGWGGDRYVVLSRNQKDTSDKELAIAWHITMDSTKDARELSAVLAAHFGSSCRERPATGPLAWKTRDKDVVLVAGPYLRASARTASSSSCKSAQRWADGLLRGAASP
jgi:hypothetical protein